MTSEIANLPKGWVRTNLTAIGEVIRGVSFPKDQKSSLPQEGFLGCLRTTNVQREVEWNNTWFVPRRFIRRQEQLVRLNDILISTANSLELVGKVALIRAVPFVTTIGAFIAIIRVHPDINPKFVYFQIASSDIQSYFRQRASTTTNISNISTSNVLNSFLGIPPLPEQQRIVAKIEELFTRLDAGVEALKKAKAQLKRYRQAVLKHAFEGKVTAEWRRAHKHELEPASISFERIKQERQKTTKGKYREPPLLDTSSLPELPEGWVWARVGDMSVVMGGKRLPKGHQYADVDTGMPYIRVTDFRNMTVDMTNLKFLKQETKGLISKYTISREDLYISIAGSIGKVGTLPDRLDDANLTENAAKITDLHNDKRYMCYVLNSSFCQEQILRLIVSSNQPKLALFRIEQIIFPLSPPSEQHQIVSEIERRFSVADQIEKTIDHGLKQAERLRQSILKRAFEGKLVLQDLNDEPAEKLLERIKAERTKRLAEAKATSASKKKITTKQMRLV